MIVSEIFKAILLRQAQSVGKGKLLGLLMGNDGKSEYLNIQSPFSSVCVIVPQLDKCLKFMAFRGVIL